MAKKMKLNPAAASLLLAGDLEVLKTNRTDDDAAEHGLAPEGPASAATDWRPAKALLKLREQVNAAAPSRSKASDGIIGDTNHQNRSSDHNPWVDDGVVTAMDITHDPERGCDAGLLARAIVKSKDSRVKYVISNGEIANSKPHNGKPAWRWRPYSGANAHRHHCHISVLPDKTKYDNTDKWTIFSTSESVASAAASTPGVEAVAPGAPIAWGKKVPAAFKAKVIEVSARLKMDPNVLMAVMAFETGRKFKSDTRNPLSGATGLIQFMKPTAIGLGTTQAALAAMSEVKQLDFVEKHLRPFTGKMNDVASGYMAVLLPSAVTKPLSHVLFAAPSAQYQQNRGLDIDDDGKVTKAEASAKVQAQLVEGMRPENFG